MSFKVPLWDHQMKALERAADLPHFALLMEMGTGKTATTVNLLRYRCAVKKRLLRTLVLGPPIILHNWKREILVHSNIKEENISVLYGHGSKRKKAFDEQAYRDGQAWPHVFITNYESLYMPELYEAFLAWNPEVLVFDEAHKLKDIKARRTKLAIKLSERSVNRYILTGTPVLNSPADLFSQFRVLDLGDTFGKNFFVFRGRYFYDKNAGMPSQKHFPDWRVRPGALEEINTKIKSLSVHVKKEDCLDLPPLVRKSVTVEMAPEQLKHYEAMKKDFITYVKDRACTAELALTKALRLQQICSGYIKLEDGTEVRMKKNPRQEALKDLLSEITAHHKVLVWACFKENYEQIREVCSDLGLPYVEVHGDVPSAQRFESVNRFNEDPAVRVFIGHPGSGGIGINLVAASYSIFYSRSFSLEHDLQAEARNHRGGSEIHARVTRVDLVSPGTIDEIIHERLAQKEAISDKILRDMASLL